MRGNLSDMNFWECPHNQPLRRMLGDYLEFSAYLKVAVKGSGQLEAVWTVCLILSSIIIFDESTIGDFNPLVISSSCHLCPDATRTRLSKLYLQTDVEAIWDIICSENDFCLTVNSYMIRVAPHNVKADQVPWCARCKPCSSEPRSHELWPLS